MHETTARNRLRTFSETARHPVKNQVLRMMQLAPWIFFAIRSAAFCAASGTQSTDDNAVPSPFRRQVNGQDTRLESEGPQFFAVSSRFAFSL
jgi:hypothetical protein